MSFFPFYWRQQVTLFGFVARKSLDQKKNVTGPGSVVSKDVFDMYKPFMWAKL